MNTKQRPLSPHLQIYRPQLTSVLSILHRISGIFLITGIIGLSWWVLALASGMNGFLCFYTCFDSWIGKLFFSGWIIAFFYHLGTGIRHLIWDAGYGFELRTVHAGGWGVLIFTVVLSAGFLGVLIF